MRKSRIEAIVVLTNIADDPRLKAVVKADVEMTELARRMEREKVKIKEMTEMLEREKRAMKKRAERLRSEKMRTALLIKRVETVKRRARETRNSMGDFAEMPSLPIIVRQELLAGLRSARDDVMEIAPGGRIAQKVGRDTDPAIWNNDRPLVSGESESSMPVRPRAPRADPGTAREWSSRTGCRLFLLHWTGSRMQADYSILLRGR
ncbi:hypothetical protein VTK56DRAFT_5852 [Thermocarpiscus australiensis]